MSFRHECYIGLDILLKKMKNMSFRHECYIGYRSFTEKYQSEFLVTIR